MEVQPSFDMSTVLWRFILIRNKKCYILHCRSAIIGVTEGRVGTRDGLVFIDHSIYHYRLQFIIISNIHIMIDFYYMEEEASQVLDIVYKYWKDSWIQHRTDRRLGMNYSIIIIGSSLLFLLVSSKMSLLVEIKLNIYYNIKNKFEIFKSFFAKR